MKDLIKIFIQKNRDAFDAAVPGAHGWKGIEKTLERLKTADGLEKQLLLNRILLDTEAPRDCVWEGIEQALHGSKPDALENFIQKNRLELDSEMPDLRVWATINDTLPAPQTAMVVRVSWQRSLLRAAASVALLIAGIGMGVWYANSGQTSTMAMSDVSGEYAELEQFYQRDIAGKQEKLATFTGSQAVEVNDDLQQFGVVMAELRRELADVPPGNREQVVRIMIENYKAKAAILQRVLERLEETKTKTDNSEKSHEIKNI